MLVVLLNLAQQVWLKTEIDGSLMASTLQFHAGQQCFHDVFDESIDNSGLSPLIFRRWVHSWLAAKPTPLDADSNVQLLQPGHMPQNTPINSCF